MIRTLPLLMVLAYRVAPTPAPEAEQLSAPAPVVTPESESGMVLPGSTEGTGAGVGALPPESDPIEVM